MSPVPADTLLAPTEGVATTVTPNVPVNRPEVAVSRTEIADTLETAFDRGPIHRAELVAAAQLAGARPELLTTLEELPGGEPFGQLRQLWTHLSHLPIEP